MLFHFNRKLNMQWTNEIIFEFLTLYETEECLWNSKNSQHKNKNEQHDAWGRIKNKLRNGNVSITELKKKRDNLMSTYRKLRSKVKESMKTGSGAEEIFKPDWPFYNIMSTFLDDVYNPRKTKSSDDFEDKEESEEDEYENSETDEKKENNGGGDKIFKKPTNLAKRSKKNETIARMDEAYNYLKQISQKSEQDECSLYTDLLCKKLRGLQEKTREIAMLEIDRLIFHLKQNETHIQSSHSQIQSVPICQSQPFNYHSQIIPAPQFHSNTASVTNLQQFHRSPTRNSHHPSNFPQPSQNVQNFNHPQQLPSFHPFPSPQPSSSFHPSFSPQPSPDMQTFNLSQQSPSFHSYPSSLLPSFHPSSPQPTPNMQTFNLSQHSQSFHPSSSQLSPRFLPSPSPQPSSDMQNFNVSQQSPSSHSYSSPQPSSDKQILQHSQQSPSFQPSPSPQPSSSFHSTPPSHASPNMQNFNVSQQSSSSHSYSSPQPSPDKQILQHSQQLPSFQPSPSPQPSLSFHSTPPSHPSPDMQNLNQTDSEKLTALKNSILEFF